MYDKIVIFGASGGAVKVAKTLLNLGYDFLFFVDNDKKKWGNQVEGKEVKSPACLLEDTYQIMIASDYQAEIEKQLSEMGILDRLVLKEEVILHSFRENEASIRKQLTKETVSRSTMEKSIVIELADAGICLGGIETWALMVCRDLMHRGRKLAFLTRETKQTIPEDIMPVTTIINYDYDRYTESVMETAQKLISMLPCTVISNWQSQVMMAAILVKNMYPDRISILSVVHNDKIALYRRQAFLAPYTDHIFCVSRKIRNIFEKEYGIAPEKLVYKESPVTYTEQVKEYELDRTKPIRIGYAARITKYQKRADLLAKVIEELDRRQIHYVMEVAGDGNYFDKLQESVNRQDTHAHLLGCIDRNEIADFWKNKDIFLSVSDFEGTSISMLEAMSMGVVPVVTLVSGVDEFVENGINGYYSEPGDYEQIVSNIMELEMHREKLAVFGQRCKDIVKMRCREDEYIDVIEQYI